MTVPLPVAPGYHYPMSPATTNSKAGEAIPFFVALLLPALIFVGGVALGPRSDLDPSDATDQLYSGGSFFPASKLSFDKRTLGPEARDPPVVTNVQIVDFDSDQRADLVVCDARRNRVLWYRQTPDGQWEENVLADQLIAPAHATIVDLDQDDDLDVVVSVLGNIKPDDTAVGSLIWLEREGEQFVRHTLLDDVRRVADAQPGDFDGDGDLDLAVAVFGYARGEVLWLENHGQGDFQEHRLHYAAGAIHVPVDDYDGDGDLDIASIISQEDEELWIFENDGHGHFQSRRSFHTFNYDLGSAGLVKADLDGDGDMDLLLPVGDNLEYKLSYPQPYHGCFWLENDGAANFSEQRIATFGGVYAADAGDVDGDGDLDVVLVSLCNDWRSRGSASAVWLENDGQQNFTPWQIDDQPTHLVTVACGDVNGDGQDDIVGGRMVVTPPYQGREPVTIWTSMAGADR